jgi:alpha,alpha-trehalase
MPKKKKKKKKKTQITLNNMMPSLTPKDQPRPTRKPLDQVIAAFNQLKKPLRNNTELNAFLTANFKQAGGELEGVPATQLKTDASFLERLNDTVIKEFVSAVIDIWPDLTRQYVGGNASTSDSRNGDSSSSICSGCADSFIPLNRTFVAAGGRFREAYYWDSYWIVKGLLRTGGAFTRISKNTIENFLDLVDQFGFVPNGARIYYLNRSQPPILAQMVKDYVEFTNDTSILARAVPLLIKEHDFWMTNRTVRVKAANGQTYTLNQ